MSVEVAGARAPCPHCDEAHPPSALKCPKTDLVLPLAGRILDEKFQLVRELGRGGMAAVWLALNTSVDRLVAIKVIRPEVVKRTETVARFRSEARAAGRINHPNICQIHDFGTSTIGPYIVMDYLRGSSLGALLEPARALPVGVAVAIVRQALAGLAAAHREGIVHRDLKPENVFISVPENGEPSTKLMDFGVSKLTDGTGDVQTEHGALLGTPEYMAPEQVGGAAHVDARSDLWAVGAMLYRALTGRLPFKGPTIAATLLELSSTTPKPIRSFSPDVPKALCDLVMQCLQRDRDARPPDAETLSRALLPFATEVDLAALVRGSASTSADVNAEADDASDAHDDDDDDEGTVDRRPPEPPTSSTSDSPTVVRIQPASAAPLPETLDAAPAASPHAPETDTTEPSRGPWLWLAALALAGLAIWFFGFGPRGTERAPARPVPTRAAAGESSDAHPEVEPKSDGGTAVEPAASTSGADPIDVVISDDSEGSTRGGATSADASSTGAAEGDDLPPSSTSPTRNGGPPRSDGGSAPDVAPIADPAGTFRIGAYLVLERAGPVATHSGARKYCEGLAAARHVGIGGWTLPNPSVAKQLANTRELKKGTYWTSARFQGRAKVVNIPKGDLGSEDVDKKRVLSVCVARVVRAAQ